MSTENTNTAQHQAGIKKFEEKSFDAVNAKITSLIETGDIRLPQNYSAENAVRSAWLHLQDLKDRNDRPVLEVCTAPSISNAILKMVVQGLSVVKSQCAFIAYGSALTFQRQYQGSIAVAKRVSDVIDVKANAVYKLDEFEYEVNADTGVKKVLKHKQTLESIDVDNVVGAYAIVKLSDGTIQHEIMNMKQIRKSWEMGQTKGNSKAHQNFADEMACKTVINRACKLKIEASDDSDLYADDSENGLDQTNETVKNEIKTRAHKASVDFDDAVVVTESKKQIEQPKESEKSKVVDEPGY